MMLGAFWRPSMARIEFVTQSAQPEALGARLSDKRRQRVQNQGAHCEDWFSCFAALLGKSRDFIRLPQCGRGRRLWHDEGY
jgi:hypothetical protein